MLKVDSLLLLEVEKHWVDLLIRQVYLLAGLSTSKDNLAASEDEQNDFGAFHLVDEPWEKLGLVVASTELFVFLLEAFKFDAEAHITRSNDVLNFKS